MEKSSSNSNTNDVDVLLDPVVPVFIKIEEDGQDSAELYDFEAPEIFNNNDIKNDHGIESSSGSTTTSCCSICFKSGCRPEAHAQLISVYNESLGVSQRVQFYKCLHFAPSCYELFVNPAKLIAHYQETHFEQGGGDASNSFPSSTATAGHETTDDDDNIFDQIEMIAVNTNGEEEKEDAEIVTKNNEIVEKEKSKEMFGLFGFRKYICTFCGSIFPTPIILYKHIKKHMLPSSAALGSSSPASSASSRSKSFKCSCCSKSFNDTKTCLRAHIQQQFYESKLHDVKPSYTCAACTKSFSAKQHLSLHVQYVHPEVSYCKLCCKNFNSEPGLAQHIAKSHTIEETSPSLNPKLCKQLRQVYIPRSRLGRLKKYHRVTNTGPTKINETKDDDNDDHDSSCRNRKETSTKTFVSSCSSCQPNVFDTPTSTSTTTTSPTTSPNIVVERQEIVPATTTGQEQELPRLICLHCTKTFNNLASRGRHIRLNHRK